MEESHPATAADRENAERARADELLAVLDALPVAIWFTRDPDAARAWANKDAAALLRLPAAGYHSMAEADRARIGFTVWRDGVPQPASALPLQRAARGEEVAGEELEVHFRDGTARHVLSRGRPLRDADGAVTGAVLAVVDITDRKHAEAALQEVNETLEARIADRAAELQMTIEELRAQIAERERAEATVRRMQRLEAIGQLTAGVAHDFNNLLTVILGSLDFLERDATGAAVRRLAALRAAAQRGAGLTAQLLAFGRRQHLQPRPVDLNGVIAGMTDLLRTTAGGTIAVRTVLEPALWQAMVDPTQIELVILNLALNARDAMPDGGTLTIASRSCRLGHPQRPEQPEAGEYVMLRISDTGVGMDADVLARAFEPFFTTKPAGRGSGLGLAQVYGFAQQSGGSVEIGSRPGEGTAVHVYLPRATAGTTTGAAPAAAEAPPAGVRILLVDDDAAVREVTAAMLADAGHTVAQFGDGDALLAALAAGRQADLLVADMAMPGMNGLRVAEAARERQPDLPVLFITGYVPSSLLEGFPHAAVLRKPFGGNELQRSLARLLDGAGEN